MAKAWTGLEKRARDLRLALHRSAAQKGFQPKAPIILSVLRLVEKEAEERGYQAGYRAGYGDGYHQCANETPEEWPEPVEEETKP